MKETDNSFTPPEARILSCLQAHPDWQFEDDQSHEDILVGNNKKCPDEIRVAHTETSAVLLLRFRIRSDSSVVCRGVLQQALDRRERPNPETDPFLSELIAAQQAIATSAESACITALSDPVSILECSLQSDQDQDAISRVLTDIADTAEEIQVLHNEVVEILQDYRRRS